MVEQLKKSCDFFGGEQLTGTTTSTSSTYEPKALTAVLSTGDVDVATPVDHWNDDVHVVNL